MPYLPYHKKIYGRPKYLLFGYMDQLVARLEMKDRLVGQSNAKQSI